LEATGFTEGQLPATLSVHIARGPTLVGSGLSDFGGGGEDTEPSAIFGVDAFLIMAIAVGGSCALACAGAGCWCYCSRARKYQTRVRPADARRRVVSEHVECSSGGYRFKRHQEEYEVETSEPAWQAAQAAAANPARAEPGVAGVAGVPGPAGGGAADKLGVGDIVQLSGLSAAAQYNGLYGTVTGGPAENGRYTVDVVVAQDGQSQQVETKAFRPDNLVLYCAAQSRPQGWC